MASLEQTHQLIKTTLISTDSLRNNLIDHKFYD